MGENEDWVENERDKLSEEWSWQRQDKMVWAWEVEIMVTHEQSHHQGYKMVIEERIPIMLQSKVFKISIVKDTS